MNLIKGVCMMSKFVRNKRGIFTPLVFGQAATIVYECLFLRNVVIIMIRLHSGY